MAIERGIWMPEAGERLRRARLAAVFATQAELAKEVKCSHGAVSNWERGRTEPPFRFRAPLEQALRVPSFAALYYGEPTAPPPAAGTPGAAGCPYAQGGPPGPASVAPATSGEREKP